MDALSTTYVNRPCRGGKEKVKFLNMNSIDSSKLRQVGCDDRSGMPRLPLPARRFPPDFKLDGSSFNSSAPVRCIRHNPFCLCYLHKYMKIKLDLRASFIVQFGPISIPLFLLAVLNTTHSSCAGCIPESNSIHAARPFLGVQFGPVGSSLPRTPLVNR